MRYLLILLALSGCGLSDARRQLDESSAGLRANTLRLASEGRLSPGETAAYLQDADVRPGHVAMSYPGPVFRMQPYVTHSAVPEYRPTSSQPVIQYSRPAPQSETRWVPYGDVAGSMPGIRPDGTAR